MKVFRQAQFKGLKAHNGTLAMPHLSCVVQVFAEKKDAFVARIKFAKGLLISTHQSYELTCQKVRGRFESQLTPWEWVDEEGRATVPPDSTETHASDVPNAMDIITLCGMVVTGSRLAGVKNPPSCTECSAVLASRPPIEDSAPTPKKPAGSDPKIVHARSSQGAQTGIVDTLCGIGVNHSYTVPFGQAIKGHGKAITCPTCSTQISELQNSKSEVAK